MEEPKLYTSKCIFCGQDFTTYLKIKKYCSNKCCDNSHNRLRQQGIEKVRKPIKKNCEHCGNEFIAHIMRPGQIFCSWFCQTKQYRKLNPDKVSGWKQKYYENNREKLLKQNKVVKDQNRFGGLRRIVMERDGFSCTQCGLQYPTFSIVVHHIDENPQHNTMQNLITLCRSCHNKVHRGTLNLDVTINS